MPICNRPLRKTTCEHCQGVSMKRPSVNTIYDHLERQLNRIKPHDLLFKNRTATYVSSDNYRVPVAHVRKVCQFDEEPVDKHHNALYKLKSDVNIVLHDGVALGAGSPGFEITVIQAGNGKLYSDGDGCFYRIEKRLPSDGDLKVSYLRCTYENCEGQAVMQRKGDSITLFHSYKHKCQSNSFFQNVTALRKTILQRCKDERRKSFKSIFFEETSSYELSAAVRAALSFQTLLPSMEKARNKKKRASKTIPASSKLPSKPSHEYSGEGVKQFVFINEDGVIEEEGVVEQCQVIEEAVEHDEEMETEIVTTTAGTLDPEDYPASDSDFSGPGLPAIKFSGKEGSRSVYTDGDEYFYHKNQHVILKGNLDAWCMTCTYDGCPGKAIMLLKDNALTLYHRQSHSCEPIPSLVDLMYMKERILERCELDPITPLKQIFDEEATSPEYAPEIGALLSYNDMEISMQKIRKKAKQSKWLHHEDLH